MKWVMLNVLNHYGLDPAHPIDGSLLGIDFGTKRIGLAVGQLLTKTATPITPIHVQQGDIPWKLFDDVMNKWRIKGVVIGIPLNIDGSNQAITVLTQQFAQSLRDRYHCPLFGMDERLTSVEARQELFDQGGYKLLKKHSIDSIAARMILEAWLQQYGNNANTIA
jgi:putative holliday junction resolvase